MKLSISNIAWEEKHDKIVYEYMKKYGFAGVEIAPTRWIATNPYDCVNETVEIAKSLKEAYGYIVPSIQSIWFGKTQQIFASEEERRELICYTKKAIDYAAAIGCKNLVFGCPKNRNVSEAMLSHPKEVEKIAVDFFYELGEYAYQKGTVIGMEANPPIYNTNFINTTKQALELIEKVKSKGFLLNLDVGTMIHNNEDASVLAGKVGLVNHVHISEPYLKPVQHREEHKDLMEILQNGSYDGFVSIEMGKQEDMPIIEDTIKYVSELVS